MKNLKWFHFFLKKRIIFYMLVMPVAFYFLFYMMTRDIRNIGRDAFIYGLPSVILYSYPIMGEKKENSEFNQLSHYPLFTYDNQAGPFPGNELFYSVGIFYLKKEPMILTLPKVEEDRYLSVQMTDYFNSTFIYLGTRTTGNQGGVYLITSKDWEGEVPSNMTHIVSPTDMMFIASRIFSTDDRDMMKARNIQRQVDAQSWSAYFGEERTSVLFKDIYTYYPMGEGDIYLFDRIRREPAIFYEILDETLNVSGFLNEDTQIQEQLKKINIGEGKFDIHQFNFFQRVALFLGMKDGVDRMNHYNKAHPPLRINYWEIPLDLGYFKAGTIKDYIIRGAKALAGRMSSNMAREAIYITAFLDAKGKKINGDKKYTLIIPKDMGDLAKWWSISAYNSQTLQFFDNEIDRYSITGGRTQILQNEQGDYVIYIQKDKPKNEEGIKNWLPIGDGDAFVMFRLYLPSEAILNGEWNVGPVTENKVK